MKQELQCGDSELGDAGPAQHRFFAQFVKIVRKLNLQQSNKLETTVLVARRPGRFPGVPRSVVRG